MNKLISELVENERVDGQFLVSNVTRGVNNNGGAYLSCELRDASGVIFGKRWDSTSRDEDILVQGNVVMISGETLKYKDNLQIKIMDVNPIDQNNVDVSRFLKPSPIPKDELVNKFNNFVASVKEETCSKLLNYFIYKYKDKLYDYPAGVTVHHDYVSGLLTHITSMAECAEFLANHYECNRDLLITGCLLHDIGKLIELTGPVIFKYTTEGKLLGHISIMVSELREASNALGINNETTMLLEHMVLSHHDKAEFGSPIPPCTKEALLLSIIDNMDSKMCIVDKALEGVEEGSFSQKVFPLDNRCLYKHK